MHHLHSAGHALRILPHNVNGVNIRWIHNRIGFAVLTAACEHFLPRTARNTNTGLLALIASLLPHNTHPTHDTTNPGAPRQLGNQHHSSSMLCRRAWVPCCCCAGGRHRTHACMSPTAGVSHHTQTAATTPHSLLTQLAASSPEQLPGRASSGQALDQATSMGRHDVCTASQRYQPNGLVYTGTSSALMQVPLQHQCCPGTCQTQHHAAGVLTWPWPPACGATRRSTLGVDTLPRGRPTLQQAAMNNKTRYSRMACMCAGTFPPGPCAAARQSNKPIRPWPQLLSCLLMLPQARALSIMPGSCRLPTL